METTTTTTTTAIAPKSLYTFNWIGGGYNQVYASNIAEARKQIAKEFSGNLKTVGLKRQSKAGEARYWKNFPLFD